MVRESFLLYKSFYEPIKSLSLEAKGALLEAIYEYQVSGVEPPTHIRSGTSIPSNQNAFLITCPVCWDSAIRKLRISVFSSFNTW